jgi:hypothetical protein
MTLTLLYCHAAVVLLVKLCAHTTTAAGKRGTGTALKPSHSIVLDLLWEAATLPMPDQVPGEDFIDRIQVLLHALCSLCYIVVHSFCRALLRVTKFTLLSLAPYLMLEFR